MPCHLPLPAKSVGRLGQLDSGWQGGFRWFQGPCWAATQTRLQTYSHSHSIIDHAFCCAVAPLPLLHAHLQDASHPVVVIDCSTAAGVSVATQLLHGRHGGVLPGADHAPINSSLDVSHDDLLVSALTEGTLVLDNIHKVRQARGLVIC